MYLLLSTYLRNREVRSLSSFVVTPEKMYWILPNGEKLSDKEMNRIFPINPSKIKTRTQLFKGDAIGQNGLT